MSTTEDSLTARRVLVTGASGMLGGAVAQLLRDKGHHVRTFQRRASTGASDEVQGSLTNQEAVARAVESMDAVIHLAAKVSFTGHWQEFVDTNITGTNNLLTAARSAGIRDFVFVSSPSVAHFGDALAGAEAGTANPQLAHGHYARSKAAAELDALAADSEDFRVTAIRPHVVWGPGDTQLVERVIQRAKAGRLPLLDHGAALIDTTYIDNAASAIVRGLERMDHAHGRALVVTNGEPRPVGELIAGICQAGGAPAPKLNVPGWLARGAGSVIEKVWLAAGSKGLVHDEPPMTRFLAEQLSTAHWFDQRETHKVLDWKPVVSIDEGIAKLRAHYSTS
ncbi:NAD-dependent epimerase/dehydratase family protein [Arthrobacter sp. NIO-1057]|uniref:NAD-dependent epimerase/dehydratase family protein n=1 Tax=Arthrobacter sp. NIO-1057 TaxID=993071 RepID=UPI00071D8229|nr:NAD-dependent epimerase/dehydratase family protein [Arthrobacter sp. NIO-1057]KSU66399.1 nucleoside-diphosphate sugar epimerase [Arthrobacter sp. NIO-1057]SCC13147.1 Nucleoside-diphosphate-sugar epimerase [Arthrobacter sp. NIO-1057]